MLLRGHPRLWLRVAGAAAVCAWLAPTAVHGDPESPASQITSESHTPQITAQTGVHSRDQGAQVFGLPRLVWVGAVAGMFLLVMGAVSANDRHKKRPQ